MGPLLPTELVSTLRHWLQLDVTCVYDPLCIKWENAGQSPVGNHSLCLELEPLKSIAGCAQVALLPVPRTGTNHTKESLGLLAMASAVVTLIVYALLDTH